MAVDVPVIRGAQQVTCTCPTAFCAAAVKAARHAMLRKMIAGTAEPVGVLAAESAASPRGGSAETATPAVTAQTEVSLVPTVRAERHSAQSCWVLMFLQRGKMEMKGAMGAGAEVAAAGVPVWPWAVAEAAGARAVAAVRPASAEAAAVPRLEF